MKARIVYHERLGDIIRCLPAAKQLFNKGYEVFIECKTQYHSLFDLVDYCKPLDICALLSWESSFDINLDLQIWPNRYQDYIKSGLRWMDFIYNIDDLFKASRIIDFNLLGKVEKKDYLLICPMGHSQMIQYPPSLVIRYAQSLYPNIKDVRFLSEDPLLPGTVTAENIPELVRWIAEAKEVVTINSAPAIIANAVRDRYDHIYQPAYNGQDDTAWEGTAAVLRDLTPFVSK